MVGKQGKWLLNTLSRSKHWDGSERVTCAIESPVFELRGDNMAFLVAGGSHRTTYVALLDITTEQELMRAVGPGGPRMQPIVWDVSRYRGRKLVVRVIDRHRSQPWGHVLFDDFSTEGEIDADTTARRTRPKP